MNRFKELKVWQESVDLAVDVYNKTQNFPKEEKYGLTSQLRRSAVSIPSNIAEGAGRDGNAEFSHFLSIAMGSSFELDTQLIISHRLNFLSDLNLQELSELNSYIQNMIFKLKQSLK